MDTDLSPQDKKDLDKFIKFFALKTVQVIIQARLGEKICTHSSSSPTGSDWFNLAIKDILDVSHEAKKALAGQLPGIGRSMCVEISLKTSEGESMELETWCLEMNEKIYFGEVQLSGLGDGFQTMRVGVVGTPIGTITLSSAYRTNLAFMSKRQFEHSPPIMGIIIDHFLDQPFGTQWQTNMGQPCNYRAPSQEDGTITGIEDSQEICTTSFSTSPSSQSSYGAENSPAAQKAVSTPCSRCDKDIKVSYTVYNRLSLLLKSLLAITRVTPAYKLSRKQGHDYVMLYRIYFGEVQLSGLGDGFQTMRVGVVGTPIGTITLSSAYRTNLAFMSKRQFEHSPPIMGIIIDHFLDQPFGTQWQTNMGQPCNYSSARTSEEGRINDPLHSLETFTRKVGAFVNKPNSQSQPPDSPLSSSPLQASLHSQGSDDSIRQHDDFVMVDIKPAFSKDDLLPMDLGTFYREFQNPPQLASLSLHMSTQSMADDLDSLPEKLAVYEKNIDEFDAFVDMLQ
ncbi:hypothetical protein CRUP_026612 [Coryphaenoides rupestris]|nr:hypothetical protein CRUP_026612 [Coryphaenoides rupestris]